MHWNVASDALPGSVRLVRVLDCWCNDCTLPIRHFREQIIQHSLQ